MTSQSTPGPRRRIGLVGAGGISVAHLPGLLRLGDVVVHSHDGTHELAAAFADTALAQGSTITVADSLDDLLAAVDVVDVVVPTHAHAEVVRAAIAAGKDVVCEKPLARTDADAADLAARAADAGVQLFPAQVVRWFPAYARLHEAATTGLLGDLACCGSRGPAPSLPTSRGSATAHCPAGS